MRCQRPVPPGLLTVLTSILLGPHVPSRVCPARVVRRGHDFSSERNEDFYQISVEVKGMGTLQKSLDDYVKVRTQLPRPVGCSSSCIPGCTPAPGSCSACSVGIFRSTAHKHACLGHKHACRPAVRSHFLRLCCKLSSTATNLDLCLLSCCDFW